MFAMVVDMKTMHLGEQFCRKLSVKNPVHQSINNKTCVEPGNQEYPVFIENTEDDQKDIAGKKNTSLHTGDLYIGRMMMV